MLTHLGIASDLLSSLKLLVRRHLESMQTNMSCSHRFPVVAGLLIALLAVVGCSSKPDAGGGAAGGSGKGAAKRFVFLTNGEDPYWDTCKAGWDEAATKQGLAELGIRVDYDKNQGGDQGQIDRLRQYGTQPDIVGIAISVTQADNPALAGELRKLQKAGVKIITVDGDVNRDNFRDARSYYIGTDNIYGGRTLGKATNALLKSRMKESGGYVQFAGYTDNDNARSRMNGFKETVGEAYTEKDRMPDNMDRSKAQENVRNALANHKDLVCLVGIWAYNGPAIAQVLNDQKIRDQFTAITFDAAEGSIAEMGKGNIDAMVVQNPFEMGAQAIRLLKAMHTDDKATLTEMFPKQGETDGDLFTTGLRVVVPNESSPVTKDLFDTNVVEFMTLPDFQTWLKKYNLKSS